MNVYFNTEFTQITVELSQLDKNSILKIYNINGQELLRKEITEYQTQINTNNLTSGVYLVRLTNSKTNLSRIFIKK